MIELFARLTTVVAGLALQAPECGLEMPGGVAHRHEDGDGGLSHSIEPAQARRNVWPTDEAQR